MSTRQSEKKKRQSRFVKVLPIFESYHFGVEQSQYAIKRRRSRFASFLTVKISRPTVGVTVSEWPLREQNVSPDGEAYNLINRKRSNVCRVIISYRFHVDDHENGRS